jgi:glucose-6-phosphate 1-epimerase
MLWKKHNDVQNWIHRESFLFNGVKDLVVDDATMITTVTHTASGASCRVHELGATILSYRSGDKEPLFLSSAAVLDGSKAIRGGIPICFPIFGPPKDTDSTMPQHGFARVSTWNLTRIYDEPKLAGATYTLDLADVTAGRGENNPWSVQRSQQDGTDCRLTYDIEIRPDSLVCRLQMENTGKKTFEFQALLHNYFAVAHHAATDPQQTSVRGLIGYTIQDKVSGQSGHLSTADMITIQGEVDRVYLAPADRSAVQATVMVGSKHVIPIVAAADIDSEVSRVSCVVWNPGPTKAAGMSDFGNDEYHDMICVEPGMIGDNQALVPGQRATLMQTINFA